MVHEDDLLTGDSGAMIQLSKQPDRTTVPGEGAERLGATSTSVAYIPVSELQNFLQPHRGHTLALLHYGNDFKPAPPDLHPTIHLNLPQLSGPPLAEVWTSTSPVRYYQEHQFHAAMNDQVMFGFIQIKESEARGLDAATYSAYSRILRFTQKLNYPHLLRIWNHFPAINLEQDGLERYHLFCIGRHQAFLDHQIDFSRLLPAATAVGTSSGILQIHFLASRNEGQHLENPRQVSAYHYPRIYGPRSPSFARATLEDTGVCKRLFIAGTSSIVGHATQHNGDPSEQTKETLRNLETLIRQAGNGRNIRKLDLAGNGFMKVYIRNPDDLEIIQDALGTHHTAARHILYLKGDICRRRLLVEIECVIEMH